MKSEDFDFLPHAEFKKAYNSFRYKVENQVLEIEMNRERELNSMNMVFFIEIYHIFRAVNYTTSDVRCVILYASGKDFSAGLDCQLKSKRNGNKSL